MRPTEPQVAYNPKSTTIGVVHTVYTYEVYAREYVCNFSGFSKRIPSLEHPRVVCTFQQALPKIYFRVSLRSGHGGKR